MSNLNTSKLGFGLMLGLVAVAACSTTLPDSPAAPPAEVQWGPLAVYRSDGRMEARNAGVLVLTDRCVFLDRNGERELLVWPVPETRWVPGSAEVEFHRSDGRVVTIRHGQHIVLGGGGSSVAEDGGTGQEWASQITWVVPPNPECLLDVRWLVGDVEP